MRFKMTNSLRKADYERLAEFAKNHPGTPIALSPASDFEHVSVSPITVAAGGSGLRIDAEVSFKEPIGFEVSDNLRLRNETHIDVQINRRSFILSKTGTGPKDFKGGLTMILKATQQIVNNVCAMFDMQVRKVITLDAESLDTQMQSMLMREELDKRGESPRPFGEIHATGPRDAKERAGGLIPLYKEHDKTYLYDAKRVYYLLPHSFVVRLLRCDATTLVRQEEFDKRSTDVLRDLVYRKYLKKRELSDGTVCYYGLTEKTQRYLKSRLEHKTPRR